MAGIRRKRLHADGGCDWPYAARSGVNRIGISNVVINGFSYQKAKSHRVVRRPGAAARFALQGRPGRPGTVTVPRPPASHANDATRRPRRRHRQSDTGAAAVATAPTRRLGDSASDFQPGAGPQAGRWQLGAAQQQSAPAARQPDPEPGPGCPALPLPPWPQHRTISLPALGPTPRLAEAEVAGTGTCGPGPAGMTSEMPAVVARALHHRGGRLQLHLGDDPENGLSS